MSKMHVTFPGFADLAERIDRSGGDINAAVDEALTATQKLIQENLEKEAQPYAKDGKKGYATGNMYRSIIKTASIDWSGAVAEVSVGFDLKKKGGWHSIFLVHGTPRREPNIQDKKLYDAIFGAKTKKDIETIQRAILEKHLTIGGEK